MKQKDLADQIGVSYSFMSDVENNQSRPSVEMLTKIAKALDISPSVFFEEIPSPLPYHAHRVSESQIAWSLPGQLSEQDKKRIQRLVDELNKTTEEKREMIYDIIERILKEKQ